MLFVILFFFCFFELVEQTDKLNNTSQMESGLNFQSFARTSRLLAVVRTDNGFVSCILKINLNLNAMKYLLRLSKLEGNTKQRV